MRYALLALPLVMLTACGGGQPAPELYGLKARPPEVRSCKRGGGIKIYEPQVAPGLDNPRIAVIDRPQHQTFYNGVRWNAPAGRVVQNYLVDTFEQSGRFGTVTTDEATTRTPYILETQLRAFHVDQSQGAPFVAVRMTASLVETSGRRTLKTIPLSGTADVSGQKIDGIVASFNEVMAALSAQLLQDMGCR